MAPASRRVGAQRSTDLHTTDELANRLSSLTVRGGHKTGVGRFETAGRALDFHVRSDPLVVNAVRIPVFPTHLVV